MQIHLTLRLHPQPESVSIEKNQPITIIADIPNSNHIEDPSTSTREVLLQVIANGDVLTLITDQNL
jgi:hypothetical protein